MTWREWLAVALYYARVRPRISTFADGETLTYGYGKLGHLGTWEYEIPPRYIA